MSFLSKDSGQISDLGSYLFQSVFHVHKIVEVKLHYPLLDLGITCKTNIYYPSIIALQERCEHWPTFYKGTPATLLGIELKEMLQI